MGNVKKIEDIVKRLQHSLSKKRMIHSVGVANTACCLAMRYQIDLEQAKLAGLLHDCAKCIDDKKKVKLCHKYGIEITETEQSTPYLLHAKLGAFLAMKDYGVDSEEVISAIVWHITGHPDMTMLEKIIFVSDYIEPSRKMIPGLEEIRTVAFTDIDRCVAMIAENTLSYLKEKQQTIDSMTIKTYEFYQRKTDLPISENEEGDKEDE